MEAVDVKWFGAKGDGIADDTSAIQNAINSGYDIFFGREGDVYKVSNVLALRSNQRLLANGAKIFQSAITPATGVPIFECIGKSNIEISGFYFEGNGVYYNSPSSKWVVLYCDGAINLSVRNNTFNNFGYSSISSVGSSSPIVNFMFSQNKIIGPGSAVLNSSEKINNTGVTIGGTGISILNNTISNTAQGLIIAEKSNQVVLSGNMIFNTVLEHGMYIDSGISNISIIGNVLKEIAKMAIKVQNRDETGYVSKNIVISNNVIDGTGVAGDGILIINTTGTTILAKNVTVTGNTISNIGQHGINVRLAKNANISNNSVSQVAFFGIYSENNFDTIFSNNIITECQLNGIHDRNTGSNITYSNNYIKNVGISGVDTSGTSSGILIAYTNSPASAGHIIKLNTVIGYVNGGIKKNPYGLFIQSDSTNPEEKIDLTKTEIRGNTFIDASDNGIRLPYNSTSLRYFGENVSSNGVPTVPVTLQTGSLNIMSGNAVPITGIYVQGSIIYNTNPVSGGFVGWVCVTAGSPGTWKTFGLIS